ncbi:MAG: RNA 2',3'-cyclic phosphodiesterase [Ktedonobacterales bacterium]
MSSSESTSAALTRTFLAVELGDKARATLTRYTQRLAPALPTVRWVAAEKLHLTLAFLGELDAEQLASASMVASAVAAQIDPFTLSLARAGYFGPSHAPRVIWIGVGGDLRALTTLQRRLARELAARNLPRDDKPFAPHLTLARIKHRLDDAALTRLHTILDGPAPQPSPWPVDSLAVMRSDLACDGATYTRLLCCPFTSPATIDVDGA